MSLNINKEDTGHLGALLEQGCIQVQKETEARRKQAEKAAKLSEEAEIVKSKRRQWRAILIIIALVLLLSSFIDETHRITYLILLMLDVSVLLKNI